MLSDLKQAADRALLHSVQRPIGLAVHLQAHTQCFSPVLLVLSLTAPGYGTHVMA
jgi:hypothetical protein